MKTEVEIKEKIVKISALNKEGAAGSKIRGWLEALHWAIK